MSKAKKKPEEPEAPANASAPYPTVPEETPPAEEPTPEAKADAPSPEAQAVGEALAQADPTKVMSELLEKVTVLTTRVEQLTRENELLKQGGVQDPTMGGRRLVTGKEPELELERPKPESAETGDFAVFRSPYPGFKQVIQRYDPIVHPNGDKTIRAPLMAEFTRGVCVLYDQEEIELMRKKLREKTKKGEADFIEIKDPAIKETAMTGQRVIVSDSVTVDTPAEALIR